LYFHEFVGPFSVDPVGSQKQNPALIVSY